MEEDGIFQQLVEIAKSKLKDGLNILFVNHQLLPVFTVFPAKSVLGLIDVRGEVEKAEEFISVAKSKLTLRVIPTLLRDLGLINSWLKQLENFKAELKPDVLPDLINRLITSQLTGPIMFIEKTLLEGFTAFLFENLISLWRKQRKDIKDVERLIEHLNQQGLIQPWLQINVCTKCHGFVIIYGSHLLSDVVCSKCNVQSTYARVYLFNEYFNQYKMRDEDLPRFICRYLQTILPTSIKVESFKWFGSDTEVDVSIKDVIGVECKTFLRELPIGKEYMKSKSGELVEKLKRYHKVGIKRVIVVTNLPKDDSTLLKDDLIKRLENEKITSESLNVVSGTIDALIQVLDDEVKELLKGLA